MIILSSLVFCMFPPYSPANRQTTESNLPLSHKLRLYQLSTCYYSTAPYTYLYTPHIPCMGTVPQQHLQHRITTYYQAGQINTHNTHKHKQWQCTNDHGMVDNKEVEGRDNKEDKVNINLNNSSSNSNTSIKTSILCHQI